MEHAHTRSSARESNNRASKFYSRAVSTYVYKSAMLRKCHVLFRAERMVRAKTRQSRARVRSIHVDSGAAAPADDEKIARACSRSGVRTLSRCTHAQSVSHAEYTMRYTFFFPPANVKARALQVSIRAFFSR